MWPLEGRGGGKRGWSVYITFTSGGHEHSRECNPEALLGCTGAFEEQTILEIVTRASRYCFGLWALDAIGFVTGDPGCQYHRVNYTEARSTMIVRIMIGRWRMTKTFRVRTSISLPFTLVWERIAPLPPRAWPRRPHYRTSASSRAFSSIVRLSNSYIRRKHWNEKKNRFQLSKIIRYVTLHYIKFYQLVLYSVLSDILINKDTIELTIGYWLTAVLTLRIQLEMLKSILCLLT